MSAIDDIASERERQISVEGWTVEHDDEHDTGAMARAAACYALNSAYHLAPTGLRATAFFNAWPWSLNWWKPKDRRRDLVRAGALIVAEIERIDRLSKVSQQQGTPQAQGQQNEGAES